MPAFIIATTHVTDPAKMAEYHAILKGVMQGYGGELVVSGDVTETLEGDVAPGEKITILKFRDEASARGYIASAEYQAGKKARAGGATMVMRILVKD